MDRGFKKKTSVKGLIFKHLLFFPQFWHQVLNLKKKSPYTTAKDCILPGKSLPAIKGILILLYIQ
jgi:hypothetical protein